MDEFCSFEDRQITLPMWSLNRGASVITSQLCLTTERFLAMDVTTIFWESLVSLTKTVFAPLTGSGALYIQTLPTLPACRTSYYVWKHAPSPWQRIRYCRAQVVPVQIHVELDEKVRESLPALEDHMNFPPLYLETVSMKLVNDTDATADRQNFYPILTSTIYIEVYAP